MQTVFINILRCYFIPSHRVTETLVNTQISFYTISWNSFAELAVRKEISIEYPLSIWSLRVDKEDRTAIVRTNSNIFRYAATYFRFDKSRRITYIFWILRIWWLAKKKKLVLRKINDSRTICGNCLPYLLFGRALHAASVTSELINRHIWFTVPVLSRAKSSDKQLCLGMSWLKVRRRWIRVKQQEKFTIHKNCLL